MIINNGRRIPYTGIHLYTGLVEFRHPRQLLSTVDVRIVALSERRLQLLELLLGEGRPVTSARGGGAAGGVRVPVGGAAQHALRLQLLERAPICGRRQHG